MALRAAVANGNWSSTATWNGGVIPTVGDVIASNGFTVTIDVNVNVDSITNAAQGIVGMVPNMTSNTTPSGIVTASASETGTFAAFNAFGGDGNTEWRPGIASTISYEFPTIKAVNQYYIALFIAFVLFAITYYSNLNNGTGGSLWCWTINFTMIFYAFYLLIFLPFKEHGIC